MQQKILINNAIRSQKLRVIDQNGDLLGIITKEEALEAAKKAGLDLIEVSPNAEPPVAKIMDYGKYSYEEKKKIKASKVNSQSSELKIIQVKIGTGDHDLALKAKKVSEWLNEKNRVKIDLFLSGRAKYMDMQFLKERLDRIMKLLTVEYKIAQDITKGPKGLSLVIEKK